MQAQKNNGKRNPKVLFLVTSFIRFKEDDSAWFDYLRLCAKEGVQYDVVAPHDREKSKGFEEIESVRIHRFQYFFPRGAQRIAYYGGMAHNIAKSPAARLQLPFFMLSFFLKAAWNVREHRIVHAMFQPSEVVAVVLKKLAGKPFVIWVQRMVFGKGITRWMQIWVLKNCDHVFFNSTFTRGEALKECKPKSFSILHMGVDLARFRPMDKGEIRKKLGLPENAKVVFAVGRFVEKKGFEYLIGAMRLLKTKGVVCAIGGFGPLEGEFKEAAEKAGLAGSVIFPGKLSNKEDVPFWINAADIFVVPSIVDSNGETETLGIVAIEGIACGRPVIASAVGGLVDVVKDGFNGFLVKQKSAEQIAGKIDLLFGKKGLIEKLGKNARAYAEENFSERQAVEKTMRVYREILEK